MVIGVGTDLADVKRIGKSIERFGDRFLDRIFTPLERQYCLSKANAAERFAARFAAKEAGMKAIGTGFSQSVSWRQFEVSNDASGKPTLQLSGIALEVAERLGVRKIHVSLSHTAEMALAMVVLESE